MKCQKRNKDWACSFQYGSSHSTRIHLNKQMFSFHAFEIMCANFVIAQNNEAIILKTVWILQLLENVTTWAHLMLFLYVPKLKYEQFHPNHQKKFYISECFSPNRYVTWLLLRNYTSDDSLSFLIYSLNICRKNSEYVYGINEWLNEWLWGPT